MKFAAYVPKTEANEKLAFLVWLSGLTCNEQNFITKAGFQRYAQKHNICVIAPDTSPSKIFIATLRNFETLKVLNF